MKYIYRNGQLAGWNNTIKLKPGEKLRLGRYSLMESDGYYVITKGRKTLKRVCSLKEGLETLMVMKRGNKNE